MRKLIWVRLLLSATLLLAGLFFCPYAFSFH